MVALNDTVSGLSELGTDLGGFMTNLAPGLIAFIVPLAIVGAVVAIILGVAAMIKRKATSV